MTTLVFITFLVIGFVITMELTWPVKKMRQRITLMLPYLQFIIALVTLYKLDQTMLVCK